jgi:hypothetical protein
VGERRRYRDDAMRRGKKQADLFWVRIISKQQQASYAKPLAKPNFNYVRGVHHSVIVQLALQWLLCTGITI